MIQPPSRLSIPDTRHNERRIVFLGMEGAFSLLPFRQLAEAGHQIAAVVIPGAATCWLKPVRAGGDLPLLDSPVEPDLKHAAWRLGVPVLQVKRLRDDAALAAMTALAPDLICVACFPLLLPASWLSLPREGCLNLHPSLLPAYRGPVPLFWQFRAGEQRTGVSLHFIDEGIDTGPIVAQMPVAFSDGITTKEAVHLAARASGELLVRALGVQELVSWPQDEDRASYQSFPTTADRELPRHWTAQRAFNFVRGAADWAPFWLQEGDTHIRVDYAYGWHESDAGKFVLDSARRRLRAPFVGGVVEMRVL